MFSYTTESNRDRNLNNPTSLWYKRKSNPGSRRNWDCLENDLGAIQTGTGGRSRSGIVEYHLSMSKHIAKKGDLGFPTFCAGSHAQKLPIQFQLLMSREPSEDIPELAVR
jgi:hypothetical protein